MQEGTVRSCFIGGAEIGGVNFLNVARHHVAGVVDKYSDRPEPLGRSSDGGGHSGLIRCVIAQGERLESLATQTFGKRRGRIRASRQPDRPARAREGHAESLAESRPCSDDQRGLLVSHRHPPGGTFRSLPEVPCHLESGYQFPCLAGQRLTVFRVRNGDHAPGALLDRGALEFRDAVLRHDVLDVVARGGHGRAAA